MKLAEILLTIRSVSSEYQSLYKNKHPIKLLKNGIKEIVEKQTGQTICIMCLPWSGDMFVSRLDRYQSKSNIWYSDKLNSCWSRFYIAKELVHVLCGNESNFTKDPIIHIESLINGGTLALEIDQDDFMIESQAYRVAIALLLPEYLSEELYALSKTKTNREIAGEFKVPEKLIEFRLSKAGRKLFDSFQNDVH